MKKKNLFDNIENENSISKNEEILKLMNINLEPIEKEKEELIESSNDEKANDIIINLSLYRILILCFNQVLTLALLIEPFFNDSKPEPEPKSELDIESDSNYNSNSNSENESKFVKEKPQLC